MAITVSRAAVLVLSFGAAASPCGAESFASSASSAGSASLGSVSDSITNSSKSSSRDTKTADGDYRVIEVAELAQRPGMLRLTLQAATDEGSEFVLTLPRQALGSQGVALGELIHARNRAYGLEFSRAEGTRAREPFFLVLDDEWHRELDPRAVMPL